MLVGYGRGISLEHPDFRGAAGVKTLASRIARRPASHRKRRLALERLGKRSGSILEVLGEYSSWGAGIH